MKQVNLPLGAPPLKGGSGPWGGLSGPKEEEAHNPRE